MRDVTCTLLSTTIQSNSIGVEKEIQTQTECPIIKIEDVYANEFYEANERGFYPTLRLKISTLNYNGETELIYNGIVYSVIRSQEITADELILVCERKVSNVKNHTSI